jgi:hypothetical protein
MVTPVPPSELHTAEHPVSESHRCDDTIAKLAIVPLTSAERNLLKAIPKFLPLSFPGDAAGTASPGIDADAVVSAVGV